MSKAIAMIYFPFAAMTAYPYLSLVPAFVLAFIYYGRRRRLIGVTALLWFCYFIYETLNYLRITCSGECNIRVDLLLIAPLLLVLTVLSLATGLQREQDPRLPRK